MNTAKVDLIDLVRLSASTEPNRTYRPTGRNRPEAEAERSTLSTAHIRPQIQYYAGASLFKVSRGGECEQVGGGRRGVINGFSLQSRLRLMRVIAKVKRDRALPVFVTLTFPDIFPEPEEAKKCLWAFIKRLRRAFPRVGLIWKLEPQERGAPHFHLLVWGVFFQQLQNFTPEAWYEVAGGGDPWHLAWHKGLCGNGNVHCVQRVRSFEGVWSYAAKYLGKTFEKAGWDKKWTGRYWGVVGPQNIPFGELCELDITAPNAYTLMRYQRRFINRVRPGEKKKRARKSNSRSLTIFCDASQWAERLYPLCD